MRVFTNGRIWSANGSTETPAARCSDRLAVEANVYSTLTIYNITRVTNSLQMLHLTSKNA